MSDLDVIVRDNDTALVSYQEPNQWTRSPSLGGPQNVLSYQTSAAFARVRFAFSGSYVAYYSDMAPDRGEYEVELDGDIAQKASAYSPTLVQDQQLFRSNVVTGEHILRVTNQEGKVMGVRYFSYRPVNAGSSSSQPAGPTPAPSDPRHRGPTESTGGTGTSKTTLPCQRTSTPAVDAQAACADDRRPAKAHIPLIVGVLCGVLVLALVALVFVLRHRRLRKKQAVPLPPSQIPEQEPPPPPYTREKPSTVLSSRNPGKASTSVVSSNYTA